MIKVKDTPQNRTVQCAVASMACSSMYFEKEFIKKLLHVANGELSTEELRQEILAQYSRE